jgi:hypothetical protein
VVLVNKLRLDRVGDSHCWWNTEPSRLEVVALMREQDDSSTRRKTRSFASDDGRVDAWGTGIFG